MPSPNWLTSVYLRLVYSSIQNRTRRQPRRDQRVQRSQAVLLEPLEERKLLSGTPVALGTETQINTYTTHSQRDSSVARDAAGDYVVAWDSQGQDGYGYGIYARRYNAAGVAQGGEFQVNIVTMFNQDQPSVGMDAAGDFVIAWTSLYQDGSIAGVFARRYNAAGVAQSGEFGVNTYTTFSQSAPSVAMNAAGNFVIAWQSGVVQNGSGQDGDGLGIYAQRFDANGVAQGSEIHVNTYTTHDQARPSAAMDSVGNFVVTWTSYSEASSVSSQDVYGRRFDSNGTALGGEFRVNNYVTGNEYDAQVAMDSKGDFVIAWTTDSYDTIGVGAQLVVLAQRYSPSGGKVGASIQVSEQPSTSGFLQSQPAVAMDAGGDFVVSWRDNRIGARLFNRAGVAQGGDIQVNTSTATFKDGPSVAMDAIGNFVVGWNSQQDGDMYGVYSQRYQANLVTIPILGSTSATNVTGTSATLGSRVASDGGSIVTERGIVYALTSVNPNPKIGGTGVTVVPTTGTTGVYSVDVSGLLPNSNYSFVGYATNAAGTGYSTPVSTVLTPPIAPIVTSPTIANLTANSATLGGNVTGDGGSPISERGVLYSLTGTNSNPQIGGAGVTKIVATGTTGIFTVDATGLFPGIGYTFVAYAINSVGTTYTSPVSTFATVALAPTVDTPTSANIGSTIATLGGNVSSDGGRTVTERGIVYSLTSVNANPQIGGTGVTKLTTSGTTGAFTINVNNLTAQSGYSFAAYAINSVGTTYTSPVSTFSTLFNGLAISTPTCGGVGSATATIGGTVTSDGGNAVTERGVLYSLTSVNSNPQLGGTGVFKATTTGTTGAFTVTINNLAPSSGYSFVAYATNSLGSAYTTPVGTFTTGANHTPTVVTQASTPTNPLVGTSANLSVLGADSDTGEPSLIYTWSTLSGPASVTFTKNGSNAASKTTANFIAPGIYNFKVTITDPFGAMTISTVQMTVVAPQTSVTALLSGGTIVNVGATLSSPITSLTAYFSSDMNAANGDLNSVTNKSNWMLTSYGANVSNLISGITYDPQTRTATVNFSQQLASGAYQLVAFPAIHDTFGNALVGNQNGTPGPNYIRNFYVGDVINNQTDVAPHLSGIETTTLSAFAPLTTPVSPQIQIFDHDNTTLTGATIQITTNYQNGEDILGFVNTTKISGQWDASTGTLTLSGPDTISNYRTALANVTYHNNSGAPNIALARTIVFQVSDGLLPSNSVSRNVTVRANSGNPSLTGLGGNVTFGQGSSPIVIAPNLSLTHPDAVNIASATVTFTNWQAADRVSFMNTYALQHSFVQDLVHNTATLTLTGSRTAAQYQTELQSIVFSDVSATPIPGPRTATFLVSDLLANTASGTQTINVPQFHQAPRLSAIETNPLMYAANHPEVMPVPISSTLLVADSDSASLSTATVKITAGYESDANGQDLLSFVNQSGITGAFDVSTGTLTLTGSSSVSNYRTALRSVTFSTSGPAVNAGSRTLTIIAVDETSLSSSPVTRTVTVTATNSAPTLSGFGGTQTYMIGGPSLAFATNLIVSDSDSAMLASATISFTNWQAGDRLTFNNGGGLQHSFVEDLSAHTATLTLSGFKSIASYQATLRSLSFASVAGNPSTTTRVASIVISDGLNSSNLLMGNLNVSR